MDADTSAGDRATPETVLKYAEYLMSRIQLTSVRSYLDTLRAALRILDPQSDWKWVRHAILHVLRNCPIRVLDYPHISIERLAHVGYKLMAQAELSSDLLLGSRAMLYRDGLMIAMQASRPIRLKNLVSLVIGRHLVKVGDTWTLHIPAQETKNRRRVDMMLPPELCLAVDRYIDHYRPRFPRISSTQRMWLSRTGKPLRKDGVHHAFSRRTKAEFGISAGPQFFRKSAATTVAMTDPVNVAIAQYLLVHAHQGTTDRYYNRATTLDASRHYQGCLERIRSRFENGQ